MKFPFVKRTAGCVLFALSSTALSADPPNPMKVGNEPAPGLLAISLPPNPTGEIWYQAEYALVGRAGRDLRYCVSPSVVVTSRRDSVDRPPWNLSFKLELVNKAGLPAAPGFVPIVVVPPPIPADTTLKLSPSPKWCATVSGASTPPEIYLKVDDRRHRVIIAPWRREVAPRPDSPR
jgi:hypothetical protein